ncbi:MAG: tRNA threonylcarbamoyladenosine dehydratase [Verrucomicrobia bacterium]|nr:tRNA threonylcarbamoyladenosine dehydratase [Verrucomicrobiota bacterium]
MNNYEQRFGGIQRLYGVAGLARLRRAHVCVIGVGGVGSWAVEALARSGVGALTLVDLDDICVSNVNRQLHSLDGQIGRAKVEAMAERVRGINPACAVRPCLKFFTAATAETIFDVAYDCVLDAIDNVANKCRLIAFSRERKIPIVTCGGAGGLRDATAVRVADLALASHDRLLQAVRAGLRKAHGFPRGDQKFGVEAIFSTERPVFPQADGSVCTTRPARFAGDSLRLNCESGFGTATFVTGTFGFAAAGLIVRRIVEARRAH